MGKQNGQIDSRKSFDTTSLAEDQLVTAQSKLKTELMTPA